jgi:hypothetical protein
MKKLYPLLFFAGVVVLMFWKVLFHSEFTLLAGRDTAVAYYPWFDVAAYWLKRGVLLLWDPYVYAGKLNMGEPQPGIFYPLNWLFMLMPARDGGMSADGMQFLLVLDYLLAAYFFYLLGRSFHLSTPAAALAGIAWAFGGYSAQIYGYANVLSGFVWFPLTLRALRRLFEAAGSGERIRQLVLCGLFLALSFLPGHHIPPIHIGLFLAFYTLFHVLSRWRGSSWSQRISPFAFLALIAMIAASLTALQWIPSAEWARRVYRWIGEGPPVQWGQAVPYSSLQDSSNLNPQDAVSLLLPYLSTNANIYTGFIVLFLALIGLLFGHRNDARFFSLALVIYSFLSWGRFSAFHGWVNTFVPGAWFAREVFYYLVMFQAGLAMLAGFGFDAILEAHSGAGSPSVRAFIRRSGWVMAILVLICAILIPTLRLEREMPMDHPYMKGIAGLAAYICLMGLLLFLIHTARIGSRLFGLFVLALVVIDLSSHLSADIQTKVVPEGRENSYIRAVWKKNSAVEFLQSQQKTEHFRVDDPQSAFPPNFGDAWRLRATMGHGATALVDYFQFRGTGWGPSSNATALLNARYIVSRMSLPGMARIFEGDPSIYENIRAVPRFFLSRRYRSFSKRQDILEWIPTPLFAPRETVLITQESLQSLPRDVLQNVESENDGFEIRVLTRRTAAEKQAERISDSAVRHQLLLYHAPWGWSEDDEIALAIRPADRWSNCYLILSYFPTGSNVSRIALRIEGAVQGNLSTIELPGLQAGEKNTGTPRKAWIDLGTVNPEEYRVSFVRTAECSANVDSLRLSKQPPAAEEDDLGDVRVVSHKPNRIRLKAELKHAGFIVASEVYYPGWIAEMDGRPVPLLEADYILRAIPVPAGSHDITLYFRSRSFSWGLALSILTLVGLVAVWLVTRLRNS